MRALKKNNIKLLNACCKKSLLLNIPENEESNNYLDNSVCQSNMTAIVYSVHTARSHQYLIQLANLLSPTMCGEEARNLCLLDETLKYFLPGPPKVQIVIDARWTR